MKTTKPADRGNGQTGLKREIAKANLCFKSTSSSLKLQASNQLIGSFCHASKSAVIVLAGERGQ